MSTRRPTRESTTRQRVPRVAIIMASAIIVVVVILVAAIARSGGGTSRSEIKGLDGVRYQTDGTWLVATVSYSGDRPGDIGCVATGPEGVPIIQAGFTVLDPGKADYYVQIGQRPNGHYDVVCGDERQVRAGKTPEPGTKTYAGSTDVKRDPHFAEVRQVRAMYQVPSYTVTVNSAPARNAVQDILIVFYFYEDGSMARGGDIPLLRFERQADGSFRAEDQTAHPDLLEVITVRFNGEDAETTVEYRWRGGGTFTTKDTWKKVGPAVIPSSTVVIDLRSTRTP